MILKQLDIHMQMLWTGPYHTEIISKWTNDWDPFRDPSVCLSLGVAFTHHVTLDKPRNLYELWGSPIQVYHLQIWIMYMKVLQKCWLLYCVFCFFYLPPRRGARETLQLFAFSSCFHWHAVHIPPQGTSGTIPRIRWSKKQIGAILSGSTRTGLKAAWTPCSREKRFFPLVSNQMCIGAHKGVISSHLLSAQCQRCSKHLTILWGRFSYDLQLISDRMMQRAVKQLPQGSTNSKNTDSNLGSLRPGQCLTAASFCHFIPRPLCEGKSFTCTLQMS